MLVLGELATRANAALMALLNQQRGSNIAFANLALYQNAENFSNGITQGNNSGCPNLAILPLQ